MRRIGLEAKGKSKRTINVPVSVLRKLDYSREWLFVNRAGGPVGRMGSMPVFGGRLWHAQVWIPRRGFMICGIRVRRG